eukprot:gene6707-4804_t
MASNATKRRNNNKKQQLRPSLLVSDPPGHYYHASFLRALLQRIKAKGNSLNQHEINLLKKIFHVLVAFDSRHLLFNRNGQDTLFRIYRLHTDKDAWSLLPFLNVAKAPAIRLPVVIEEEVEIDLLALAGSITQCALLGFNLYVLATDVLAHQNELRAMGFLNGVEYVLTLPETMIVLPLMQLNEWTDQFSPYLFLVYVFFSARRLGIWGFDCWRRWRSNWRWGDRRPIQIPPALREMDAAELLQLASRVQLNSPTGNSDLRPEHIVACFCPITHELMSDPVRTADGFTYDREAIELWLRHHWTSPLTNLPLHRRDLTPNFECRERVTRLIQLLTPTGLIISDAFFLFHVRLFPLVSMLCFLRGCIMSSIGPTATPRTHQDNDWKPLFALEVQLPRGKKPATSTSTTGRKYTPATERSVRPARSSDALAVQRGPGVFSAPSASPNDKPETSTGRSCPTLGTSAQPGAEGPLAHTERSSLSPSTRHSHSLSSTVTSNSANSIQEEILEELDTAISNNIFVDNFGFYVSLEEKAAESAMLRRRKALAQDQRWSAERLPRWSALKPEDLKRFCRQGVPQFCRKEVWLRLLRVFPLSTMAKASPRQKESMAAYATLTEQPLGPEAEEKYGAIIDKDLPRTFGTNILFDSSISPAGQELLRRVLRAYCLRNKKVGYCQGMASVAATLLLIMEDDYDTFLCLGAMMEKKPYSLEDYFSPGFPELNRSLVVLEGLVRKTMPKLCKVVQRCRVPYAFFATSWMLTLFSHSFNFRLVCRIWDMFLCEGWKPVFRVMLALLKMDQDKMLEAREEMHVMNTLQHAAEDKDPEEILAVALDIGFKTKDMMKLRDKAPSRDVAVADSTDAVLYTTNI